MYINTAVCICKVLLCTHFPKRCRYSLQGLLAQVHIHMCIYPPPCPQGTSGVSIRFSSLRRSDLWIFVGDPPPILKTLAHPRVSGVICFDHFSDLFFSPFLGPDFSQMVPQSEYSSDFGAQKAPFWLPFWSPFWAGCKSEN